MRLKWNLTALAWVCGAAFAVCQEYFPANGGVKAQDDTYTAFTGATIHISPGQVVQNATLLIHKGKVVSAGSNVRIPENTRQFALDGKHIYPSFIDVFSEFGMAAPKRASGSGRSTQYDPSREGHYWNDHIRPEQEALDAFKFDEDKAKALRKLGFGVVNTHLADGIARGTGALVALSPEGGDAVRVLEDRSGHYFSFERSVTSRQSYPSSLMGAMALLRQMYYDARWYEAGNVDTHDRSLEALLANRQLVQFFAAGDKTNVLRADRIGDTFGIQYVILAGGQEYEQLDAIKATGASLVVPLNFPDAYDVADPYQAAALTMEQLKHWNQAPSNPARLAGAGISIALSLHGLKKESDFTEKLRKAIAYGLTEEQALEALTTTPARLLGQSDRIGSLQNGREANFLITSGPVFDSGSALLENWVRGRRSVIEPADRRDIRGTYNLSLAGKNYTLELSGEAEKPKLNVLRDTAKLKSTLEATADWAEVNFTDGGDRYRFVSRIRKEGEPLQGKAILPDGREIAAIARRTGGIPTPEPKEIDETPATMLPLSYPNVGYGYASLPRQEDLLFRNATVWTSEAAGVLEETDVLIRDGKISRIGKGLNPGNARVIDATGKHLTAGIIDEHSHLAGVDINESGQNSSAEVRMSDVLDPEDVDIYRNLAGGVTTIQLLHGSANPIGGQSAILKLKWGRQAAEMLYDPMPKFIKFALGENVKQSNWQSFDRFPQTRMGVEQVFLNYFQRAKEYQAKKDSGQPYRYDEEMETLAEILRGERYITCHSYVQSEINMLMKVAEKMGFKVNTFTHILEGYKVADKMAEHGVGGSTFSDWWAYKFEVNDAIPYNAAIMHRQGVTVAINSDDAEMSRRLNQEAAKTIKYGGLTEEEAWNTVTINPARLLHLEHRVGSIREGKDADLVLWTGHPLSVYSRAETTYVEGVPYFDLEQDARIRTRMDSERNQLIQMMLADKGNSKQSPRQEKKEEMHCDSE